MILKLKKYKFHQHKSYILINNININKKVIFNEAPLDIFFFEYLVGYKDAKNRPLCIVPPKMSAYRRKFDKTKCMPFSKIFRKIQENLGKSQQQHQKKFNSESLHNKKYLKPKIKFYKGRTK